jgi:hypothetical protein
VRPEEEKPRPAESLPARKLRPSRQAGTVGRPTESVDADQSSWPPPARALLPNQAWRSLSVLKCAWRPYAVVAREGGWTEARGHKPKGASPSSGRRVAQGTPSPGEAPGPVGLVMEETENHDPMWWGPAAVVRRSSWGQRSRAGWVSRTCRAGYRTSPCRSGRRADRNSVPVARTGNRSTPRRTAPARRGGASHGGPGQDTGVWVNRGFKSSG